MAEFELTFPDEERTILKSAYQSASTILEYGSGGSTVYAACETEAQVLSIESDRKWCADLNKLLETRGVDPARARAEWVNIGKTKKWGYPEDGRRWKNYPEYVLRPWDEGFDPDLVLIDGRFRRACFAAVLMGCKRDTTILFDDYSSRETYQQVENFLKPVEVVGRMARFEATPASVPHDAFLTMVRWFFKVN
ncbi:MAG: hypothetical protein AAF222_15575 [Pseudomonadota bacterium]